MTQPREAKEAAQFIDWFRQSSPYIHAFRGKVFVVVFDGEIMDGPQFPKLIQDLTLLNNLGIKLVLMHGLRPQIDRQLHKAKATSRFHHGIRITDDIAMKHMKDALGSTRIMIESLLSMGLSNTPISRQEIRMVSGNFITACPMGVIDGINHLHTGKVRRIDHTAIQQYLADNAIVLLSPIGYSPTGESFNLMAHETATAAAIALQADKLIFLTSQRQALPRELTLTEAKAIASGSSSSLQALSPLQLSCLACGKGVRRCHILDQAVDGAILLELFTRDGCGTLVSADHYDDIRHADITDVGGIMNLIEPLEEKKVLVKRSRQTLETDIHHYIVVERDGTIIGCAALFPFHAEKAGEIACLAVHGDYQNRGYGDKLLKYLVRQGRKMNLEKLFVLTTQTTHWFLERGFQEIDPGVLPVERRLLYNYQRKSRTLIKPLPPG